MACLQGAPRAAGQPAGTGMSCAERRRTARALFDAAVAAADPARAVSRALGAQPLPAPGPGGRTLIIAFGKAAPAMTRATLGHVTAPWQAICVTQHGNPTSLPDAVTMHHTGHPVPDEAGLAATCTVLDMLDATGPADRVVALISGGGSALLPAPVSGLTLADKIAVNRRLLESGLDIVQMNLVRQQLSRLKGGGLARCAAPAPVTALILSDVIGDDLRAIASGPTAAPIGTAAEAAALLRNVGLWPDLPPAVRAHLAKPAPRAAPPAAADNRLVGSNRFSLDAARTEAQARRIAAHILSDRLTGDVGKAAKAILDAAAAAAPGATLLFGGETTVHLRGAGTGGRNQELALCVALGARARDLPQGWVFLSGGTDGRDGPTDAAGGLVDCGTAGRIAMAGGDAAALLADNDSNRALRLAGDLLITGATGTNVADIQILLMPELG